MISPTVLPVVWDSAGHVYLALWTIKTLKPCQLTAGGEGVVVLNGIKGLQIPAGD